MPSVKLTRKVMDNLIMFPRQQEHWCTSADWKLLKSKMKVDKTAYLACAYIDIELGDFIFMMGTDSNMHRARVIEAWELEHPIRTQGGDQNYLMLVTVKLCDPKPLTTDCDISIIGELPF